MNQPSITLPINTNDTGIEFSILEGIVPKGTKYITDTHVTDVTNYQYAQVQSNDLTSSNILETASILGIVGSAKTENTMYGEVLAMTFGS